MPLPWSVLLLPFTGRPDQLSGRKKATDSHHDLHVQTHPTLHCNCTQEVDIAIATTVVVSKWLVDPRVCTLPYVQKKCVRAPNFCSNNEVWILKCLWCKPCIKRSSAELFPHFVGTITVLHRWFEFDIVDAVHLIAHNTLFQYSTYCSMPPRTNLSFPFISPFFQAEATTEHG
jgi:hypothetical protein